MFSSYNHRYFTTNVLSRENNEDLAHWPNTPFNFDIPPGLRLLDDEPLVSPSLSPEGNDLASGRQVYQQPLLTQPQQINQMPAASGLTPFLSPSSPPPTSNFSAIYPSPTSSQRSIPAHSSEMSEELLQRQLSNSQPVITVPTTQGSPISPHTSALDIVPQQSGLLTPPLMMMTGNPHYPYSHVMDQNYVCQLIAEEDKRRRNTAASARFRIKKKMREQALEKSSRDLSSKAETLENKVRELEKEIKWLRSLIVEKDPRLLDVERPDKQKDKSESQGEQCEKNPSKILD